jgi:hypothetical protein
VSIQAVSWALAQWIPNPGAKLVLVAVANYADHRSNEGWPSLGSLIEETCMSRRTIQRHISELVEMGVVVKSERFDPNGRQTSNLYRLDTSKTIRRPETPLESLDPDAADPAGGGCQIDTLGGVTADTGEGVTADALTTLNRQKEPSQEPNPPAPQGGERERASEGREEGSNEDGFDAFWSAWPEKLDSPSQARAVWRRLSSDDRRDALAGVDPVLAALRRSGRKMKPSASTYLRDRKWTAIPRADRPSTSAVGPGVILQPFSRDWWIVFIRRVERRERVQFMAAEAVAGRPWSVPDSEAPTLADQDAAAAVLVQSDEFRAWEAYVARKGARLPRPSTAQRIWMPSARPPADDEGREP